MLPFFFLLPPACIIARQPIGRLVSLDRRKLDTSADASFYSAPKLVTHTDDEFITALKDLYRERLPQSARVLDIMASHVSHLPADRNDLRVDGHGMNAEELAANPALSSWHVRDLNKEPSLPFAATAGYDAILCCAGVQYLQEPEAVFAECSRALEPTSGVLIVSFTDRFFFPKAIQGWIDRGMATRARLVKDYLRAAGGFREIEIVGGGTSLLAQIGSISGLGADPFVAVVATRDADGDVSSSTLNGES